MSNKKTKTAQTEPDFENSLKRLEDLAELMESGSLTLEESLTAFEEGVKLTRKAQQYLSDAEQKVNLLIDKQGEPLSEPLAEKSEP